MRARVLVGAAAAAIAIAGTPAYADCIGCGGGAAPGTAAVGGTGSGSYNRHTVTAECSYKSVPNGGAYIGSFTASVTANEVPTETVAVRVTCSLQASGGYYTLDAPGGSHASAAKQVPGLMPVMRLCLSAHATWQFYGPAADSASVQRCTYPGFGVATVDIALPGGGS